MKTKILKPLLIAIGLLITSVTTPIWAWELWGNFYFSTNSNQWSEVSLCIGDDNGSAGYHFTKLDHTQLWYRWLNIGSYGDAYFINADWGDENWWSGWNSRPYGRTYYLSSDDKWQPYKADYNTNKPNGPGKRFYFDGVTNSSKAGDLPTYTAYLRVRFDEDGDGTYNSYWSGGSTWDHGLSFDFTGTYMNGDDATDQSTIHDLNKNYWGTDTWGYGGIPVTGEVTFDLKSLDTGFEIEGWAYDENDATTPVYTDNVNNPTFNVLGNTSYMAFIRRKSYTVTLNDNGGSGGSGSKTVRYDLSTNMTTSVSVPSKSGYSFQGYYTGQDGTGSMVINASGVWQKNVTNYTGTDGSSNPKWIRDDGATLYAKWTQTVDLHDNHGGSNNGSISAIYNGVMSNKSVPTYTDHTLDLGYYAESSCTTKVMNLDGSLVANVTDGSSVAWTNSSSKWIHNGGSTLYAHWKVNAPSSITCTDNVVTIAVPTDATVHYTTNGTTPTASSPTYDPSNKPVIASSGITVKAIAVQSGCTNSEVTLQAVTYTPVYTVTHTLSNASKSSGETSVLENKAYTAVYEDVTGYDLPSTITVTVGGSPLALTTGYTWSVSEGTGTLNILANKITGNVVITINGDAETYNGDLKNATGTKIGSYTATYGAGTIAIDPEPTNTGYDIGGYYLNYNVEADPQYTNQVATYSKTLLPSVSTYTSSDSKWAATSAPDLIVKWVPHKYTVYLDQEDGEGGSEYFKVEMNSSVYEFGDGRDDEMTTPTRTGYDFAGYYSAAAPSGTQIFDANGSANSNVSGYTGGSSKWTCTTDYITLYAHWTPVALTFNGTTDGDWGTASNWSPACVPTIEHDVTINAETTINGSAVAKSVTIGSGGKVTIQPTGVLEVAGTVTNTDDSKLIINTNSSNQGALICDLSSAPAATVNMSIPSGDFHLIASPTGGVKVSSTFAGSGIYTYAWEEGKGWDRRGYYDDFMGNEAILICGQTSCSFSGILSNACGGSARYSTGEGVETSAQGVNMIANPLTAPIKIAAMTISGSKDGAVHLYNGSWVGKTPATAGDAVIPAMQGYGVIATSGGGSVSFTYDAAVRGASSKNAPLNAPKRTDSDILDHITLSVTTNDRKVDLNLYENEQFTERIDVGWEAIYMEGDGRFGELYAIADEKMNILATPDLEGTVLGFVPGQAASYTISFEGDGKGYYLNDLDMQESILIEEGNTYVFTPNESTNATRFVISKMPIHKTTTGNDAIYDGVKARKQMIDGILYIIRDGRMYDATGALVK